MAAFGSGSASACWGAVTLSAGGWKPSPAGFSPSGAKLERSSFKVKAGTSLVISLGLCLHFDPLVILFSDRKQPAWFMCQFVTSGLALDWNCSWTSF